ncbi:Uncharacterized protein PBTT_09952 [Plasmodiophora brassicae]|nr:hypothetical protein PBRA_001857 [Plasmodiophora brassicae]
MRLLGRAVLLASVIVVGTVRADCYMHNPRGSNDRNREQNSNRNNANRLFNSQNNAAGGYPWAGDPTLVGQPDPLMFFATSKLRLEWTIQHSCGPYGNAECTLIIQYMNAPASTNLIRDGYPTGPITQRAPGYNMSTFIDPNQNADGTNQIPLPPGFSYATGQQFAANDPYFGTGVDQATLAQNWATFCAGGTVGPYRGVEFGVHESCASYARCRTTSRNQGLYTADQALGGNDASYTRQQANQNRFGLECQEERDYYPYWNPSEWKDIAVLTSNSSWCAYMQAQSQNIMDRYYCVMPAGATALAPITQAACVRSLGTWTRWPNWGLPAPPCIQHATSRDNHLGNDQVEMFAGQPQPVTANYVWTIPASLRGQRFVVRFRYNISATTTDAYADFNSPPGKMTNSALNCQRGAVGANGGGQCSNDLSQTGGPVALYNNPYVLLWNAAQENDGMQHRYLALAVNTAQVGRTFQDRSYVMEVRQDMPKCTGQVINLNVRGKRGNIVQAYPAVEYDWVPNHVQATQQDCFDVQWTGSDFNPAGVAGEGADQTDRHNLVEFQTAGTNPSSPDYAHLIPKWGPSVALFSAADAKMLAYANQSLPACANLVADNGNTNNQYSNCAKLNAAPNTYRHPTLLSFPIGGYVAGTTRNNNFSNRHQKLHIIITSSITTGVWIAIAVVTSIIVASAGACLYAWRRPNSSLGRAVKSLVYGRRAFDGPQPQNDTVKYAGFQDAAPAADPAPGAPAAP